MVTRIVTDSASDIPAQVARELGITVVPLNVIFGSEVYRDGIDLTTEQFCDRLVKNKTLPTTSVPPPAAFAEIYDRLAGEADEILVITISHKLSATYDTACQATGLMEKKCRVQVVDSFFALAAQGLIVIASAKASRAGMGLDELAALTRRNIGRVDMRIAFDTLEYLQRGGRIGKAQAFLGSMLNVNPIITLKDGESHPVARERCRAKALDHLYNFAAGYSSIEEIAVEDATTPDEATALVERLDAMFPGERIYRAKLSPAITTHVGPRAIDLAILGDK